MRLFMVLAVTTALLWGVGGNANAMTLSNDGETDVVISIAADAIEAEQTAASELQEHLQKVTGAQFTITPQDQVAADAKQIAVGQSDRFAAACPDVDIDALKNDGIVIRTVGDTLYLAGGRPRGTLYAVYTFLEDTVGCRWWSSTESYMPTTPTLEIPELDTVYVPKLHYREAFYRDAFNGVFAARSKCNGHFERVPEAYGGHYTIIGWCHTFNALIPPDKYFTDHPEWFSEIGGKRLGGNGERVQLCLTNDEMRAELTKNALEWIRKQPEAGIISISQNDWGGQCQCGKCLAIEEEEGSPSGPLLRFVNSVAEEIEKEFPDFLIETLAYHYTRKAPKLVRPRENVIVRLCSIECSFAQPLETGPQNTSFADDIRQWSSMAPNLYIWDYVTNFRNYVLPHPNLRVLAPNVRFFVDNNCVALFEQGDAGCSCSDFPELRAWLLAHVMWDQSRDENALIDEFMKGYYGPAAEPLMQYINLINDTVEESGAYLRCFLADTSSWLSLDALKQATKLFNEAQARVDDDEILSKRVQRARMPLDHVWLLRHRTLKKIAKTDPGLVPGAEDPAAFAEAFVRRSTEFNIGNYSEGQAFSTYAPGLQKRFRAPGPPPEMCKGLAEEDWIDVQDNEFTLHGAGSWVSWVEDQKASDGMAARMPANHPQWATQLPVGEDLTALGKARCFAQVRCDTKADQGVAFDVGIYDGDGGKGVVAINVPITQMSDGEYHTIDLGALELKPGMYFWFAPANNPEQMEAIYVDRIFCIKADKVPAQE